MKLPFQNPSSPLRLFPAVRSARSQKTTSGVALVIVLSMLALMAILIIAFLSSVTTELRSAKSYAGGNDARSLADTAVNIVISQIQDATSTPANAWASQPGMIRTYDNTGAPVTNYKLYSSDNLRVTGTFNPNSGASQSTDVPAANVWAVAPDQYVDLNSPVSVAGINHYPIIDPAAVATSQTTGPLSGSPAAMDGTTTPIQGCYVDPNNTAITVNASQANPVPMPVKWMYVLQDGTLASMSAAGIITTTSGGSPTTANPIVGRVAFWTDDESCKVNINTSGEGTFWGRSHTESNASGGYERNFLGFTLPAQNEFQRYPGHPAMTSLSVIFPPAANENTAAYNEAIYGIVPRLGTGGSVSGTTAVSIGSAGPPMVAATPLPLLNANRLYNSVDELLFSAAATTPRTANWNPNSAGPIAPTIAPATGAETIPTPTATFTQGQIEKARFFLTANSRSPEVNMFNKPRITLWPEQYSTVHAGATTLAPACWNPKDKLIAFCSTIGTTPYYFQRYNSYDYAPAPLGSVRINGQSYPQSLNQNPIPSSQSPTMDWTMIPPIPPATVNRNQTLFTYLQYLTSNPIPGLGGSLSGAGGKYTTAVRDQILTEIMDFIRSEITTASVDTATPGFPTYFYAPGQSSGGIVTGERQVVPLVIKPPIYPGNGVTYTGTTAAYQTKGFGRFDTIQQAAFVFYRLDPGNTGSQINIGVVLVLEPWNSVPGTRPWCENMRAQVTLPVTSTGSGHTAVKYVMRVNNADLVASTTYNSVGNVPTNLATNGLPFMTGTSDSTTTVLLDGFGEYSNASALMGPEFFFYYNTSSGTGYKTLGPAPVGSATEDQFYPLYASFTLPSGTTTFNFTAPSSIIIKLYPGYDPGVTAASLAAETPVQTITMPFPQTGASIPLPVPTASWTNYNSRLGFMDIAYGHQVSQIVSSTDTVRSIEPRWGNIPYPAMGDLRVFSALASVPQDYFDSYGAPNNTGNISYPANAGALQGSDDGGTAYYSSNFIYHSLRMYQFPGSYFFYNQCTYPGWIGPYGSLIGASGAGYLSGGPSGNTRFWAWPAVVRGLSATQVVLSGTTRPGDWDTGPGSQPDGPYINKPDESTSADIDGGVYATGNSQYGGEFIPEEQGNTLSPNRLISSAVAFGSLPTGIDPDTTATPSKTDTIGTGAQSTGGIRPWQTLLFCPNPASESGNTFTGAAANTTGTPYHPGFGSNGTATLAPPYTIPPDDAFLDFFTMPIVEPYAISEPFSTAGKVNMNYQIVPFTYLTRDTAVRAVLKSARMMAMPPADAAGNNAAPWSYKISGPGGPPDYRYTINPDEVTGTLAGFQNRFSAGDIFRSASEICSLYLIPQYQVNWNAASNGETVSTTGPATSVPTTFTSVSAMASAMNTWWKNYTLTGDNVREEPYGYIYPRLTTKSNAYTVHVWTQTLKKAINTPVNQFVDGTDQVTSEYRGSYIVQRYLDPNSDSLITTDGTNPANPETYPNSMVGPYKFRIVNTKRFAP